MLVSGLFDVPNQNREAVCMFYQEAYSPIKKFCRNKQTGSGRVPEPDPNPTRVSGTRNISSIHPSEGVLNPRAQAPSFYGLNRA